MTTWVTGCWALRSASLSTSSRQAAEKFGEAQRQIRTYHGDPIATLDKAVELDPKFAMAWITRAIVLAQLTDRLYADEIQRSLTAAAASPMSSPRRSCVPSGGSSRSRCSICRPSRTWNANSRSAVPTWARAAMRARPARR